MWSMAFVSQTIVTKKMYLHIFTYIFWDNKINKIKTTFYIGWCDLHTQTKTQNNIFYTTLNRNLHYVYKFISPQKMSLLIASQCKNVSPLLTWTIMKKKVLLKWAILMTWALQELFRRTKISREDHLWRKSSMHHLVEILITSSSFSR